MSIIAIVASGVACAAASAVLTIAVARYATAKAILDVPNERSSHAVATPRGGGMAIAVVVLTVVVMLLVNGAINARLGVSLLGCIPVAAVGWLDDRRGVAATTRFLVHLTAAVWAVAWISPGTRAQLTAGWHLDLGVATSIFAVLGIIWLTNLYNFMDGIDGIAGAQAVTAGITATFLLAEADSGGAMVTAAIAGSALGFLIWNWSPSRIFMGDVGSGTLGFLFGALVMYTQKQGEIGILAWILLLAVFVVDATVTVIRRAANGERWYLPHRSHAYQRAVQSGLSHARVTLGSAVLSISFSIGAVLVNRSEAVAPVLLTSAGLSIAVLLWIERRRPVPRRTPQVVR